jgi:hypothetical protein
VVQSKDAAGGFDVWLVQPDETLAMIDRVFDAGALVDAASAEEILVVSGEDVCLVHPG